MSCFNTIHWGKTWYLTTCIIGMSILEIMLWFIEIAASIYYGFGLTLLMGGFALNYITAIVLLLIYFLAFQKHEDFKLSLQLYRKVNMVILIFSALISNRLFKLTYSNIGNRNYFALETIFTDTKCRRLFYLLQLLTSL